MDKNIHMTSSLFIAIKSLIETGATYAEVQKYYKVSNSTCKRIKDSDSFEEYKQIIAAIAAKNLAAKKAREIKKLQPVVEKPVPVEKPVIQPPVPSSSVTQFEMLRLLKEQNDHLKLISDKLAFIVEQLS